MFTTLSASLATIFEHSMFHAPYNMYVYVQKIACFGPSKQASQIEASKAWSKEFMRRHNLPTAAFRAFSSAADFSAAQVFIESVPHRVVVKVTMCLCTVSWEDELSDWDQCTRITVATVVIRT